MEFGRPPALSLPPTNLTMGEAVVRVWCSRPTSPAPILPPCAPRPCAPAPAPLCSNRLRFCVCIAASAQVFVGAYCEWMQMVMEGCTAVRDMAVDLSSTEVEITTEIAYLTYAKEGEDWEHDKNRTTRKQWVYKVPRNILGKRCTFGPYSLYCHLKEHMQKAHKMDLLDMPKGRPPKEHVKGKKRKVDGRKVDVKKMNAKIMTNPFKRARKEFLKNGKAWKSRAKKEWNKLQEKAQEEGTTKGTCPILVTLLKGKEMALLGIPRFGEGVSNTKKCEVLHNYNGLASLVVGASSKLKKVTVEMKTLFKDRDWNENESARRGLVKEVFDWHRVKFMTMSSKEGKDK